MNQIVTSLLYTGSLVVSSFLPQQAVSHKDAIQSSIYYLQGDRKNFNIAKSHKVAVLPLTLIEFRVTKNNADNADLMWKTAQEVNLSRFDIEKSTDGRKWEMIGFKSATGQQGSVQTYYYKDQSPSKDANYYRLHIMDRDGKSDYSPVRLLIFGEAKPVRVYPTLANSNSTFYVEGISPEITLIEIYNNEGRLLQKIRLYSNTFTVPYLSPGAYHVRIINTSNYTVTGSQKIIIQ
ncbi:MAG TPA: T9SS type A sorting domain-containing protein [Chitinophagaceae bacterium]